MKKIELDAAAVRNEQLSQSLKAKGVQASFLNYLRFKMVSTKLTVIYSASRGL